MGSVFCNAMNFGEKKLALSCFNKAKYEFVQYSNEKRKMFSCGQCLNRVLKEKLVLLPNRIIEIKVLEKLSKDK